MLARVVWLSLGFLLTSSIDHSLLRHSFPSETALPNERKETSTARFDVYSLDENRLIARKVAQRYFIYKPIQRLKLRGSVPEAGMHPGGPTQALFAVLNAGGEHVVHSADGGLFRHLCQLQVRNIERSVADQ